MKSLYRTALVLASALLTGTLACGGASTSPGGESAASEIDANAGQVCDASPPPNARCAAECPYGYAGAAGTYSCECCTAPPVADAGEVCGGPPPNARCEACPGGGNGYKQIDGQPTCECCGVAPDAGADAGEVCGGPPPNARCKGCPGGGGYKQIDGQPTCECCSS